MKIKVFLALVFTVLFASHENAYCAPTDYYPAIKIPVMLDGYNLRKVFDNPKYTKSLNYYVKVKYPANEVIKFYESQFEENGWIISKDNFKGKWQSFIDGTIKGNPEIQQRLSLWVKPKLKLEAFLVLRYEMQNKRWSDLHVVCQIQPRFDSSKVDQFLENLKNTKTEIYLKFVKLIDSFHEKNSEFNEKKFYQVMKQNEELAPYFIEYKKMADEMTSEIKEVLVINK